METRWGRRGLDVDHFSRQQDNTVCMELWRHFSPLSLITRPKLHLFLLNFGHFTQTVLPGCYQSLVAFWLLVPIRIKLAGVSGIGRSRRNTVMMCVVVLSFLECCGIQASCRPSSLRLPRGVMQWETQAEPSDRVGSQLGGRSTWGEVGSEKKEEGGGKIFWRWIPLQLFSR